MLKKARWLLVFGVICSVAPVTKAAVFDSANLGYRKNILYNLHATVGNGTTTYGSYTQTLMQRPKNSEESVADRKLSDRLELEYTDETEQTAVLKSAEVNPANQSSGVGPQPVMLQSFVTDNPMLINS